MSDTKMTDAAPLAPVANAIDPNALAAEIGQLASEHRLTSQGAFEVFWALRTQIPGVMHEIGRLRELTFRAADEGTGQPLDIDGFDDYYLHVFLWDRDASKVVGAYRVGPTDEIIEKYGVSGLYTSTLFRYEPEMFERLGPALEMGRSFVRQEYQKAYAALLLLWKGIGQLVLQRPHYRRLFGPVSISRQYDLEARSLIAESIQAMVGDSMFPQFVRPRVPFVRVGNMPTAGDLKTLATMLSERAGEPLDVPILLRQYLRLGGRVIEFNVDPDFSDVLDALIVVDLMETDPRILARYLGPPKAESFRKYHLDDTDEVAPPSV